MKPSQVAANLRRIATYIEQTHQPSRAKVASTLKNVISGMATKTAAGGIELTLDDGTKVQHNPSEPAPESYDPGMDPNYHVTCAKVALLRALSGLSEGDVAPVELSGLEGYGSLVENSDDLALVANRDGKIVLEMGPNEQEMEMVGEFASVDEAASKFAEELSVFSGP